MKRIQRNKHHEQPKDIEDWVVSGIRHRHYRRRSSQHYRPKI